MAMFNLKRKLINKLLAYLLCTVNPNDVMSVVVDKTGKAKLIYLKGEQIAEQEWKMFSEEVKYFENTRLYHILFNTLPEQAKIRMFEKSKNDEDMVFGKAMLYTCDTMKQLMKAMRK
jgi:hypothetical protein